ncbi:hypothetical protein K5X82_04555 [Halosquirtibacter xylanolyticus]|uniref:BACON domain-containing protein n=1 Tax=Halosquirtibacter xylanolyticus TaxID=3374599 RepID=UPI0037494F9F|nr:hypothetical protein K5X82_04555 [Prolixibacteraceae bacterium]
MKNTRYKSALSILMFFCLFPILMVSCSEEEEEEFTIVDLRYNPKDKYQLSSADAEEIKFEVKSSHPWKVFGKENWYTINPESGPQDQIFMVSIKVEDNTLLDDRVDTITIKSDYWVGKRFTIEQKGIARLEAKHDNDRVLKSVGDQCTFTIESNQEWSCEVTDGGDWLSIDSGIEGSHDGEVMVSSTENKGEERTAIVTVYDRHKKEAAQISVRQAGVRLVPGELEWRESHRAHEIEIKVESNTQWTIAKPDFDVWYKITSGVDYSGTQSIKIQFDENSGISVRKSSLTLKTVSEDPSVKPLVKTIVLKQAPTPSPEHTELNKGFLKSKKAAGTPIYENGDMICSGKKNRVILWLDRLGTHTFRIKSMAKGSYPVWYIIDGWGKKELRYHLDTNKGLTKSSVTTQIGGTLVGPNVPLDINKAHDLSVRISSIDGMLKYELALDGEHFSSVQTTIPENKRLRVYLGANKGDCTWDWYEYYPLVKWDE